MAPPEAPASLARTAQPDERVVLVQRAVPSVWQSGESVLEYEVVLALPEALRGDAAYELEWKGDGSTWTLCARGAS